MAQCLDLRRESFAPTDRFLLDTNVVYDVFGNLPGEPLSQRAVTYQEFASRSKRIGATLFVSALTFFELASIVERRTFAYQHGRPPPNDELKLARRDTAFRAAFVARMREVWAEVCVLATILDASLAATSPHDALALLATSRLDGYDPGLLSEARRHHISTIVTHDADFESVRDLIVLTANDAML